MTSRKMPRRPRRRPIANRAASCQQAAFTVSGSSSVFDIWVLAALGAVGVLAGFVDAVAGGGGLIAIPALLSAGLPPVAALATNKAQSIVGTFTATVTYW